jgi:hypothetical protein
MRELESFFFFFLKEKPFHRLRVINIREKTNNSFSFFFVILGGIQSFFFVPDYYYFLPPLTNRIPVSMYFFCLLITNTFYTVSNIQFFCFFFVIQFP